jgi:hypothetical protein
MTLALYGKSRRRQGALITLALLAVIIAAVGALSAITVAFAHHAEYEARGTCTNWRAHAGYEGGTGTRLVIIENVTIGGHSYVEGWSSGFSTGTGTQALWGSGTSNGILPFTGGTSIGGRTLPTTGIGALTTTTNVFFWFGVDNTIDPARPPGTVLVHDVSDTPLGGEMLKRWARYWAGVSWPRAW